MVVPYAQELADYLAKQPVEPRVTRDFARLLTLIKAVAVLRYTHRKRDPRDRIVAEIEDYATVYDLVSDMYEASATGAGKGIAEVVQAVKALKEQEQIVSVTAVAKYLGLSKEAARKRIARALHGGWLVNAETRRGHAWRLELGEPLPDKSGLPTPDYLSTRCQLGGLTPETQYPSQKPEGCQPVNPVTVSNGEGCALEPVYAKLEHWESEL